MPSGVEVEGPSRPANDGPIESLLSGRRRAGGVAPASCVRTSSALCVSIGVASVMAFGPVEGSTLLLIGSSSLLVAAVRTYLEPVPLLAAASVASVS